MCRPSFEFQYVNPTTQVALFSHCQGTCSSLINISWSLYQGTNRSSTGIQWTLFNDTRRYENQWFFGMTAHPLFTFSYLLFSGQSTSNFTSLPRLFLAYPSIEYWKFEVTYVFATGTSSSALNFQINQPPSNGSCSISPMNGTTTTPFTLSCPFWFDTDEIKDYSVYGNSSLKRFARIDSRC